MLARQGLSRPQLASSAPARPTRTPNAAAARTRSIGVFASSSTSASSKSSLRRPAQQQQQQQQLKAPASATSGEDSSKGLFAATAFPTSVAAAALAWLAAAPAAFADDDAVVAAAASAASAATDFSKGGFAKESYYVTLGLFLLSLPGLWSQIKRAPKAKRVRRVYEVPGPASPEAMPLDERARQIFRYFKQYNYSVAKPGEGSAAAAAAATATAAGDGPSTSSSPAAAAQEPAADVIRFVGRYAASRGQAAALVFYVFCGLASTALVLSIAAPVAGHGEWWYALTALSPLAGLYYWQRGDRDEEFLVKMTTADDDSVTDISVEGDAEEADRMAKTLGLGEKGKVYVKGILG